MKYDLVVIGSGPAGQNAAIFSSKIGKNVLIVESDNSLGGVCQNRGTIPSKTLRETALFMTNFKQRIRHGITSSPTNKINMNQILGRMNTVIQNGQSHIYRNLEKNSIAIKQGWASFQDNETIKIQDQYKRIEVISTSNTLISTGTIPHHPDNIPFDNKFIHDASSILHLTEIPNRMTIVGGGVIGCEYACIFAKLGVKVTVVEERSRLLPFLDKEISNALEFSMRDSGVIIKMGEKIVKANVVNEQVEAVFESNKTILSDILLYTVGRYGNTDKLDLEKVSLEPNHRGLLCVNETYQTSVENIYAAGDVIGIPSLASTSSMQGRIAAAHMFKEEYKEMDMNMIPYGIYTIPEISMAGETEETLTDKKIPYEVGIGHFRETGKGQILNDEHGVLKLLFNRETRILLGVHAFGESVTELIHIGQAVMAHEGTIDYFLTTVFNYPTFAEVYKIAAQNGINRLRNI